MTGEETPPPTPRKIQPDSPFFLGSQDRPGDFITPNRLRNDNYDDWAVDIQAALEARRKFEFLDGTITGPTPPCTQSDWTIINAMLVSWITNTIHPEVKSNISKFRDAKRLWDHLKQHFAQTNGPRIQQLKSSIAKCEQTKTIVHEARQEQSKLHQFLMGLYSDYYATLRTNILSQDPLPMLDRAYQLVTQDEQVRKAKQESEEKPIEALGFHVRTGAGRGRGRTERPVCSHCNKPGHEAANCWYDLVCSHCKKNGHEASHCYELVGYPEHWQDYRTNGGAGRGGRGTSAGRGRGALANAATGSNNLVTGVVANAVTSNNKSVADSANVGNSSNQLFTSEQWKALAGLFGNSAIPENRLNGKFDNNAWIIDTGATHHIMGKKSLLFDTQQVEYPVGLPNGEFVIATLEGSVCLSDTITLKHVLYAPHFSCNLLSVSQLNDDLQSIVQFDSYMCAIQDPTKELIGTGVRRDGLYYFKEPDSVQHVTVTEATSNLEL
ncbi:uncharacterized protein [Spinacia oleracea]|uniref:CCHC-type domain-containing protein n=1 Tax=Spinacia oleracea TaxID=3562 RepID=A0ABM3RPA2_SPIOL|nr:uncharacterized protein LOC110778616 [Spinacia oleracea]